MITKDSNLEEINIYITNSLLEAIENKDSDIKDNVKLDIYEPYDDGSKLLEDFADNFFKYNGYIKGSYNNNLLVDRIYEGCTSDSYILEEVNYLVYAAASSLINTCHPFTDVEDKVGMTAADSTFEVIDRFIYKYLTWCFSSPKDKFINWNYFNKKTSAYENARIIDEF